LFLYLFLMEEQSFVRWMRQTNQIYVGDEYKLRLGIFTANSRYVKEQNRAGNSWTVALNKFACLTPLEYRSRLGSYMHSDEKLEEIPIDPASNYPDTLDWRNIGVVNPVKDQGDCNAGWAFAAIQAVESTWAIKKTKLYSLSESNIIDCSGKGCNGWSAEDALIFAKRKQDGLLQLEEKYPYSPIPGQCHFNAAEAPDLKVKYPGTCLRYSEMILKRNIASDGPAACPIDASLNSFQLYNSGIYADSNCKTVTNHYVGVVGYGAEGGKKYWILRNSWGSNWGEEGYMRLLMSKNLCGILNYPVLARI